MNFSFVLPILITLAGAILLVKLRFFFILHPIRTARTLAKTLGNRRSRSSLMLALAGTLGVGNIFGVCAGIMLGGAGSVFWIAVSSLFSMVIKYAECALSFTCTDSSRTGMHSVILDTYRRFGKGLSYVYAALCAILALFMGSALQSNAVCDIANTAYGVSPAVTVILLALFLFLGINRGTEKIEKITSKLVPLTTIIYILLAFCVIIRNISRLPDVIFEIVGDAFSPLSAGGGILAFLSSRSLSEGYSRGILSNEAGTGTSSLAHARERDRTPAEAGVAGICEVFFDTSLLCVLTGVAVICAVPDISFFDTPMSLICAAVATLGEFFSFPLTVSIFIFAYSTVICWYYYGGECIEYLFCDRVRAPYSALFFIFAFAGAFINSKPLISLTDAVIFFMALITLATLMRRAEEIRKSIRSI